MRRLNLAVETSRSDERGFTLIELLIVVAVLGIVASILVLAVVDITVGSAKVGCRADARSIETALEVQRNESPNPALNSNGFATIMGTLAPAFVRSLPSSSHYKIDLGSNTVVGHLNPAAGATGTPADFNAGTVLVSAGADLSGPLYRNMHDTVTDECSLAL